MTKPTKSAGPTGQNARQKSTATKAGAAGKQSTARTGTKTSKGSASAEARKAQSRKIVAKRQTPWGFIGTLVAVVVIAAALIGYAATRHSGKSSASASSSLSDAGKIPGIQHYTNLSRTHQTTLVTYPQSPPVGGNHSPVWADCTGTVYPNAIANENAVHTLEHGSVWITYRPGLPADQLDVLSKLVAGNQYTLLSPYPGLKTAVSLQAWGYQLFVDSASDPRVQRFVNDLKLNQQNTPELGASCDNPAFKKSPSTPGHPTES